MNLEEEVTKNKEIINKEDKKEDKPEEEKKENIINDNLNEVVPQK